MSIKNYPERTQEVLKEILRRTKVPIESMIPEYNLNYKKWLDRANEQMKSATLETRIEMAHRQAAAELFNTMTTRPPLVDVEFIYTGIENMRFNRSGDKYRNVFFMENAGGGKAVIRSGMAKGAVLDRIKELNLFTRYNMKIGKWDRRDNYVIDNRFDFDVSTAKVFGNIMTVDFINNALGITPIKLDQVANNTSRKQKEKDTEQSGFTDLSDWRCIIANISRKPGWFTKKNTKGEEIRSGVYNISDETTRGEPEVDSSGEVSVGGFACWAPEEMMIYDEHSECAFYGTIDSWKDKKSGETKTSMSCFLVKSILSFPLEAFAPGE